MKTLMNCKSTNEIANRIKELKLKGYTRVKNDYFNLVYSSKENSVALVSGMTDKLENEISNQRTEPESKKDIWNRIVALQAEFDAEVAELEKSGYTISVSHGIGDDKIILTK
jgi:predicted acetyltransferase